MNISNSHLFNKEVELGSICSQKHKCLLATGKLYHVNSLASSGLRKMLSATNFQHFRFIGVGVSCNFADTSGVVNII